MSKQLAAITVGLALWSISAVPTFAALVIAYAVACALLSTRVGKWLEVLPNLTRRLVLVLVAVPAAMQLVRAWPELAEQESLASVLANFGDRLRLEREPSIAPPLVSSALPQTFFVHAESERDVRVRLADGVGVLRAQPLGKGLYRVDYDPRRDGKPKRGNGAIATTIWVGSESHTRELHATTPQAHPRAFARSADGTLAATVSEETDELIVVSSSGLQRRVPVGDAPTACAFVGDRIAVGHRYDSQLWLIDARSYAVVARVQVGDRVQALDVSPSGSTLAIARGGARPEVLLMRSGGSQPSARAALSAAPDFIAFGADDSTLIVATRADATLHRLRIAARAIAEDGALRLSRAASAFARIDTGLRLIVAVTDYRADRSAQLGNHFVQDQLLAIDLETMSVMYRIPTARRSERQSRAGDVDRGLSPLAIAQDGELGFLIAFAGSDELWRMTDLARDPQIIDLHDVYSPQGVVELQDGSVLVSSAAAGAIGIVRRGAREVETLRLAPDDGYLQKRDPLALAQRLGERGFYEGTRAGIACQSCHMQSDSDLAAYNLGDHRLLPTLSVRGLLATAPYLRDGSYPTLADLDHVAQDRYRGYLRRVPGRPETLQAYLESLPRVPSARALAERDVVAERRGVHAFVEAGCPSCHAFPAFTNLGQHRTAELFPDAPAAQHNELLDVPSLLSVGATAPYLSDGRARTLDEVLVKHNRGNRHGDTAQLTAAERRDLIAFLETL